MPFRSEAQRRFLWAKHPSLARKWTDEYGSAIAGEAVSGREKVANALAENKHKQRRK